MTPLEAIMSPNLIRNNDVLLISASGRNSDIITCYKAVSSYSQSITAIVLKKKSLLALSAEGNSNTVVFDYEMPAGKDGFLATNSLISFFGILQNVFESNIHQSKYELHEISQDFQKSLNEFVSSLTPTHTLNILYSGWGTSVAVDIESKFTEAALGTVHMADYRNFAHGRHHWFAKRGKTSAIIALITPYDAAIAEKTLSILPKDVNVFRVESKQEGAFAAIELLYMSFFLSLEFGRLQSIDPGRPGVPPFGSKLYNLKYAGLINKTNETLPIHSAINLKLRSTTFGLLNSFQQRFWVESYRTFVDKLRNAKFEAIIFDYDGTLCSSENRLKGPENDMFEQLNKLLKKKIKIGIATGRGKSVRTDLVKGINKEYYKDVLIGYYNGSQLGYLDDQKIPNSKENIPDNLIELNELINSLPIKEIFPFETELRPYQIQIVNKGEKRNWEIIKRIILHNVYNRYSKDFTILQSSHSIDIIPSSGVSKNRVLNELGTQISSDASILCIGDKGDWPGNDFQLLDNICSLSVDECSASPDTCWNLAPQELHNCNSLIYYLSKIKFSKNQFTIDIA
jgi:HAD superfamily hydrolase (TIGR01484 family)